MSAGGRRGTGLRFLALVALALSATGSHAFADMIRIEALLSGAGEAPPTDSAGAGRMEGSFDSETRMLAWTVAYSGLSSPALSADFHGPAPPGEIAPIQVATPGDLASPFHGLAKLDDAQARDLMDGRWYFNLHSKRFPAGEIRGPVVRR
jgi:CHRD domain